MVAYRTGINTTAGTKYTEWVELETIPGDVASFAANKNEGAMTAKRHTDRPGKTSFWMDSSRQDSERTWASIAWCDPG